MKPSRLLTVLLICCILLLLLSGNVLAGTGWETIKDEHFIIFFKAGHEEQAKEVLKIMEYYRPQVEKLCGNETRHYPIVIDDMGTIANGFTDVLLNQIHIFQYPFTRGVGNWWANVGVHEYTHQLSLSKSTGLPGVLHKIFGNFPIFLPNVITPGWIKEGMTVYSESQLSPYQGRLNDGLYDAYIAASAAEGRLPSILDATYAPVTYQMDGLYTYGGEFFNYLSKTYGEDKFAQFFAENGGSFGYMLSLPSLSIDSAAIKVYGRSFPALWDDWTKYETEQFKDYKIDGERVTKDGWNVGSPVVASGKIYYQRSYPVKTGAFTTHEFNEIVVRDPADSRERTLLSTTTGFSQPLKIKNDKLYYACLEIKPGFANASQLSYGGYSVLHEYDLNNGGHVDDRVVLREGLRAFDILADGSIIFAKDRDKEFGSDIYLFNPATSVKKLIFQSDYRISEFANDGSRIVVAAQKDWENLSLYLLNLETGEFTPLVHTPYVEEHPSLQGDKLYFTANYQKIPGAFCYDFTDQQVYRVTQNGLAEEPVYDPANQRLYFVSLDAGGYDLYNKPLTSEQMLGNVYELPDSQPSIPPSLTTVSETGFSKGTYLDDLKTLIPQYWLPISGLTLSDNELGIGLSGADAIGDFPGYAVSIAYDFNTQRINSSLDLMMNFFAPLQTELILSDVSSVDSTQRFGELILQYPLVQKLSPGLSSLAVGTALVFDAGLKSPVYNPYLLAGFQYPKTKMNLKVGGLVGEKQSGVSYLGLYGDLNAAQYLPHSQLSMNLQGMDLQGVSAPGTLPGLQQIRGYTGQLQTDKGSVISLEYTRPLLKIRNGSWNPNLYFEDLAGKLFLDQASGAGLKQEWSWGAELHLETKVMYMFSMDWGLRLSQNMTGKSNIEIFIGSVN